MILKWLTAVNETYRNNYNKRQIPELSGVIVSRQFQRKFFDMKRMWLKYGIFLKKINENLV